MILVKLQKEALFSEMFSDKWLKSFILYEKMLSVVTVSVCLFSHADTNYRALSQRKIVHCP